MDVIVRQQASSIRQASSKQASKEGKGTSPVDTLVCVEVY